MSKTTAIIAIVVALIALGIILWIIFISVSNVRENNYCDNWKANLDNQKIELESQIFPDTQQYNREVADYNRQCAY